MGCAEVDLRAPGMMGEVAGADYVLFHRLPREQVEVAVQALNEADRLIVQRDTKRGVIDLDVRPLIRHLSVREDGAIELSVMDHEGRAGKAREFVELLGLPAEGVRTLRKDIYVRDAEGALVSPSATWEIAVPATDGDIAVDVVN